MPKITLGYVRGKTGEQGQGLSPQGTYDPTITYHSRDLVTYNGSSFIALKTTTGNPPSELDTENWQLSANGVTGTADGTTYDNTASGLEAENLQEAIDKVVEKIDEETSKIPKNVLVAVELGEDDPDLPPLQAPGIDADRLGGELPEYFASAQSVTDILNELIKTGIGSNNLTAIQWRDIVKSQELPLTFYTNWDNKGEIPTKYGSGVIIPALDSAYKFILHIGNDGGEDKNFYLGLLYIPYNSDEPYRLAWEKIVTEKQLPELVCNPNWIINSYFKNPINQRGIQTGNPIRSGTYGLDHWRAYAHDGQYIIYFKEEYVKIDCMNTYGAMEQVIENSEYLSGKTVTLSIEVVNVSTEHGYIQLLNNVFERHLELPKKDGIYSLTVTLPNLTKEDPLRVIVGCNLDLLSAADSIVGLGFKWIKLELGSIATRYVPPNLAEEILKCERYYREIGGTYLIDGGGKQRGKYFAHVYCGQMRINPTCSYKGTLNDINSIFIADLVNGMQEINIKSVEIESKNFGSMNRISIGITPENQEDLMAYGLDSNLQIVFDGNSRMILDAELY